MSSDVKIVITIAQDRALDEMAENMADLHELLELIPAYSQAEARRICQRIGDRHISWVTAKGGTD